jgi:hypothetical protein
LASCSQEKSQHLIDVKTYYIDCDSVAFDSIHQNFKENIYIATSLKSKQEEKEVKMRLRGDSSREYPKKSLKLKLSDGNLLAGKSVFNFNAEYKDPSFSHSYFSSLVFKKLDYPCFSSSMAKLYVNDKFHGLFLEIENMDKDFLIRNGLNPNGDLYKATKDGACLFTTSEVYSKWEKKSNKKSSWRPLLDLIEDLQEVSDEDFQAYIKANFHYSYLIDFLAANIFIANGSTNYHNYYLYRDAENMGKWMLIPWDLDKTLSYYNWKPYAYHFTSSDWENDNPLIERCYLNDAIRSDVQQRLLSFEEVLGEDFYEPIYASIKETLKTIVLEDKTDKVNSEKDWTKAIAKELKFLNNRPKKAAKSMDAFPLSFKVHETASQLSSPFYLSWDKAADSNQVSYEVYLSKDFLYQDTITTRVYTTTDDFVKIDEDLALGTYHWKVVAVKDDLKCDGFNSKNSFELKKGTQLPIHIQENTVLTKQDSPYRIPDSMSISKNAILNIEQGVVLLANHNAQIKVFGGLNILGTKENKVEFRPIHPNGYFHSIYFYSSPFSNRIEHTNIKEGLLNSKYSTVALNAVNFNIEKRPMQFGNKRPSIIWVWHGDIKIDSIRMKGNKKGEGININWASSSITNSSFYNTPDAIELINVKGGLIQNNFVWKSPDDAIDLNGCDDVLIQGNTLANNVDKGISIGAEQYGKSVNITVIDNYVYGNKIALSVKDSSTVTSSQNVYAYNKMGIQAYLKNKAYAVGGEVNSDGDILLYNDKDEVIDENSSLLRNSSEQVFTLFKTDASYFSPSQLSYEVIDSVVNIYNNSFFAVELKDWTLTYSEGEINFNSNQRIPANGFLQLSKSKITSDKYFNYMICPSLKLSADTQFSLTDSTGKTWELSKKIK